MTDLVGEVIGVDIFQIETADGPDILPINILQTTFNNPSEVWVKTQVYHLPTGGTKLDSCVESNWVTRIIQDLGVVNKVKVRLGMEIIETRA